jgi:K+/H+ antiporter YhaU regulatory subunit KhtT
MRKSVEKQFIFNPPQSTMLEKDDMLVVIGNPDQLVGLKTKLSK